MVVDLHKKGGTKKKEKKIVGYKTIHTLTKKIEDKRYDNKNKDNNISMNDNNISDINNNNNNNNNNNIAETMKYWVNVQQAIVSSHGERDPL